MLDPMRLLPALFCLAVMFTSCKGNRNNSLNNNTKDTTAANRNANSDAANDYKFDAQKPYPYETGELDYQYTGDFEGTEKVYFKDYGRTYRVEENYINKAAPTPEKVSLIFIKTPANFTYINNNTRKGYTVTTKDTGGYEFQGNLLHDFVSYGIDSTMRKNGYKKAGNENIAGKECQTYTSGDGKSKFCFWNGINVKTNMKLGEHFNYTLEATNIDKDASVGDDLFSPPAGIAILPYDKYVQSETKDKL